MQLVRALPAIDWRLSDLTRPFLIMAPVAVAFAVLWPVLGAPFGPQDDYQLAGFLGADRTLPMSELPATIIEVMGGDAGRFRPLYYPLRVLETALLGDNSTAWHVARLVLLLVSMLSALVALRGLVPMVGALLIVVLLVAGPQAEVWVALAPNEAYGVPLLVGGLALYRYGHVWPAVVLIGLAGLTKESFAVFNLALVAGMLLHARAAAAWTLLSVTAVTLAGIGVTFITSDSAYGIDRSAESITRTFAEFTIQAGLGIVIAALLNRRLAPAMIAALLVVLGQATLAGDFLPGRYLLPGALAFALPLIVLFRAPPSRRRSVGVAIIAVATVLGLVVGRGVADTHAADAHRLQAVVERVQAWRAAEPDDLLVYAPRSANDAEWFAALSIYTEWDGTDLDPVVTVPPARPPRGAFESDLLAWLEHFAPSGTAERPCLSVQPSSQPPLCAEMLGGP